MSKSVIDGYRSLLHLLDVNENNNGQLIYAPNIEGVLVAPLKVTIKRGENKETLPLVLPTNDVLSLEEDGTLLKFHPFSESPFSGQSEVQNLLLILASGMASMVVTKMAYHLVKQSIALVTGDESPSNKLMKLISAMPAIKAVKNPERILTYAGKVLSASTGMGGKYPLLRFNLSRKKRTDTADIRWCQISSKVFNNIEGDKFNGVRSPLKTGIETVRSALGLVLDVDPSIKHPTSFYGGEPTKTAPYFMAFLRTLRSFCEHIEGIQSQLGAKRCPDIDLETGWFDLIDQKDKYASEIPVTFEGSIGVSLNDQEPEEVKSKEVKPAEVNKLSVKTQPEESKELEMQSEETEPQEFRPTLGGGAGVSRSVNKLNDQAKWVNHQTSNQTNQKTEVQMPAPKLRTQPAPSSAPTTNSKFHVQRPPERKIRLVDSLNQPVLDQRGIPVMVTQSEVPSGYFIVGRDPQSGRQLFESNGDPVIYSVTADELNALSQPMQQQQMYNNNGFPQQQQYNGGYQQPQQFSGGYSPEQLARFSQQQPMQQQMYNNGFPQQQMYNNGFPQQQQQQQLYNGYGQQQQQPTQQYGVQNSGYPFSNRV